MSAFTLPSAQGQEAVVFELLEGSRFEHLVWSERGEIVESFDGNLEGTFVMELFHEPGVAGGPIHDVDFRSVTPERTYDITGTGGYGESSEGTGSTAPPNPTLMYFDVTVSPIREAQLSTEPGGSGVTFPRIEQFVFAFAEFARDPPILDDFGFYIVAAPRADEAARFFRRGDANSDGRPDISDPIAVLLYLFVGGRDPSCLDAADADDDGEIEVADAIFLLDYLFRDGPWPPLPVGFCGLDATGDGLGCEGQLSCTGR